MTTTIPKLRASNRGTAPRLEIEREVWESGATTIAGIDEVGRGAWAGPLTIGVAVIPRDRRIYKVRDSKMLTENERELMHDRICNWVMDAAVGHASDRECDELGMAQAQRLATKRALVRLKVTPDAYLADGNWDFVGLPGTRLIVKGDQKSLSIATASIIAKVTRDRIMRSVSPMYPGYNFASNKGYPCPTHKAAISAWGPTSIHRRSWVFMDNLAWTGVPRYERDQQLSLPGL